MNYIIVGGSGFIGSHLIKFIRVTDIQTKIVNFDIVENNHGGLSEYHFCDIRQPIIFEGFTPTIDDVIFNFAAIHRTPGYPDFAYFETNIKGAENVCNFARKYGIKRVVFTSSIAPYGASEELKCEDTLPLPNTAYGMSKLVAEKIHSIWVAEDAQRELTIVRPGVVFGLGENGNFTRMYWGIRNRKFAYPGRKDTIKACIYVKDLVAFLLYKLNNHSKGTELFNCTFEPAYTIEHIVESMKKATNLHRITLLVPTWVLMPIAYLARFVGSPLGICPERVRKLMISTNICGKKMHQSGYQLRYTLESAIEDWLKDSGGDGLK